MSNPGEMVADISDTPQQYAERLKKIQEAGHRITMVQFADGVWVITYVMAQVERHAMLAKH